MRYFHGLTFMVDLLYVLLFRSVPTISCCVRITMGKKSKANRNKATVASLAVATVATVIEASLTVATATVAIVATAAYTQVVKRGNTVGGDFAQSSFFIKAESFRKKGNHPKDKKIYLQGIDIGCVPCMNAYGCQILFEGDLKNVIAQNRVKDNPRLHLVIPLLLECAIRMLPKMVLAVMNQSLLIG